MEEVYKYIDRNFDEYVEEVRKFLRQPGIPHTGEGIKESAEMTLGFLKDLGIEDARLVPLKGGNPVAYGKLKSKKLKAKTILLYQHYDVVPVKSEEWTVPPFKAEMLEAKELGLPPERGKIIVARGAYDKKSALRTFLLAVKAMLEVTGDIPVNLIFVIEGEEELGAPHLPQFRDQFLDELKQADSAWFPAMRQDERGKLILNRGYKGYIKFELQVKSGEWGGTLDGRDLWSGDIAMVDAPLWRLVWALNSLVDSNGKILIEGFYDNIRPLTKEEKGEIETMKQDFDEETWKKFFNVKEFQRGLPGKELFVEYVMGPLLNIDGIIAGWTGPGVFTTVPMKAVAKCDVRIVPDQSVDEVYSKMRKHLDKQGFPEVEIIKVGWYEWSRTPITADIYKAAIRAAEKHKVEWISWPSVPASDPSYLWNRPPLNLPTSYAGLGYGERYHRADEYVTVEGIRDNLKYVVTMLNEYAKI